MKKLGLVGGLSWVSTLVYYEQINRLINQRLGNLHAADMVIRSLDFGALQAVGWPNSAPMLRQACQELRTVGAEVLALCANTAHLYADFLEQEVGLPLIHIGIATADAAKLAGYRSVGLLGTIHTMELDFYTAKFRQRGIDVLTPKDAATRAYIQKTLRDELGIGVFHPATKTAYLDIIEQLIAQGAEAIVLACTEIPLLLRADEVPVPTLDSTQIHIEAIVDAVLAGQS